MSTSTETTTIDVLERVLVSCRAEEAGYRRAADEVDDRPLRTFLAHASADVENIGSVLARMLGGLGREQAQHGSPADTSASGGAPPAPHTLLGECCRRQQATLTAFAEALGRPMPEEIREAFQVLFLRIVRASAELRRKAAELEAGGVDKSSVKLDVGGLERAEPKSRGRIVQDTVESRFARARPGSDSVA